MTAFTRNRTLRLLARFKRRVNGVATSRGYRLRVPLTSLGREFDAGSVSAIQAVARYTMTPPQRIVALRDAVAYLVAAGIPGAFVECGVWRAGSVMAAANELIRLGCTDRDLWLYDTFAGMTAPTELDNTVDGRDGRVWFAAEKARPEPGSSGVTGVSLQEVRGNVLTTGYPGERCHFVEGPVEETLHSHRPELVALLRLDTDFYESTRAELEQLYPRLVPGGILILDDYGYWLGAQRAVDEYFAGQALFFHRIDESARLLIKPGPASG